MNSQEEKKRMQTELEGLTSYSQNGVTMTSPNNDVIVEDFNPTKSVIPKLKLFLAANVMVLLTCVGIILGFALGFAVRELHPSKDALMWIGMPGELFLRMLKMMIVPLIVCSVITGTASLDPKVNGKISAVAFTWIVITNVIACIVAVVFCLIIKPGKGQTSTYTDQVEQDPMETQDIFADLLRNVIPDNMIAATFRKARTRYTKTEVEGAAVNGTNGTALVETLVTLSKYKGTADGINVLGLIVISSIIGIAINQVKGKANVLLAFFSGATDVTIVIIRWFFWLTPVGVASLIAVSIAGVADIEGAFTQLGKFLLTVVAGILLHQFLILPAIFFILTRRNPFLFLASILRPYTIGFASGSTAVAIPEMLQSCEEKNKIDSRVTRFVIPFCVTLNADGSAIYIASAAYFVAQLTGTDLGVSEFIVLGFLTAVAAMAIPSVPSASIVTLVIILTSLNIPAHDIALLFAVEWILDRIRTALNVVSHCMCAVVTYRFCKKELQRADDALESSNDVTEDTTAFTV